MDFRTNKKPEKHDKVEFDIAVTAFTFDIDSRLDELIGQALSTDEKVIFKKYLRALTKNLIDGRGEGSIENALKKIQILKSTQLSAGYKKPYSGRSKYICI